MCMCVYLCVIGMSVYVECMCLVCVSLGDCVYEYRLCLLMCVGERISVCTCVVA